MKEFVNGKIGEFVDLLDTDGNVINVSDGGVIYAEGKYHWYGQVLRDRPYGTKGEGGQVTDAGVAMYASTDLVNWEYEGVILAVGEGELKAPMRFERPKIIYNEKTGQYVLWCHYVGYPGDHGNAVGTGDAGVAVCDRVNGSYRWLGYSRPIDSDGIVRDMTLFKDDDGSAYLIYDRDISPIEKSNRCIYAVKLSEDYLRATDEYRRIDCCYRRDAPTVVKRDGYYYMTTSGMTGWDLNPATYYRSRSILGDWEELGDPCVGDTDGTTFASQPSFAFKLEDRDLYIHVSERHNTNSFLHCSYLWLPMEFEDGRLKISYKERWFLD